MASTDLPLTTSSSFLLTIFSLSILFLSWCWRRSSLVEWAWALLVERWGNPALLVDNITPNLAGDMATFLKYKHFLFDLRTSLVTWNLNMIDLKVFFFLMTEMLAFTRVVASVILIRNILVLLMLSILQRDGSSDMTDVSLITFLVLVDMIKAAYVVYRPVVLIPDTIEAHLVMHMPVIVQMILVSLFEETQH